MTPKVVGQELDVEQPKAAQIDKADSAEAEEKGLDQKIDDAFKPVAVWWEGVVLTPIPIAGNKVPAVVIILVCCAGFFTIYFGFINVRLIPFAIRVVSGKYDDVEKGGEASKIKKVDVSEVDGDLVDTIRDEGHSGEVSHFQALATAVSGTVGLGNIAGVAVAIAVGGAGATFG